MQFEHRLWEFTQGVRLRIAISILIGVAGTLLGVTRLALLGWLIGLIFLGESFDNLLIPIITTALIMLLRGFFEHWRTLIAHKTSAKVQKNIRKTLYNKIMQLGPGYLGRQRSGEIVLSLVDGVEQLETYFGEYLPQLIVSAITPLLIFFFVAFLDLPVATILLTAALFALFLPSFWHKFDTKRSLERQKAYASFASDFLDGIQGLATLKSFGQSKSRIELLRKRAFDLFRSTMWVLATNSLSRGITDTSIAVGASVALGYGAFRVVDGEMELSSLLVIMMMGVEIFRPMRDLRTVLHQGMVGLSAAQGIYKILDAKTNVNEENNSVNSSILEPNIEFKSVKFNYPNQKNTVHNDLNFNVKKGERIGIVGSSGCGKSSIVKLLLRFYDPDKGVIKIGGKNIKNLSFNQIRNGISVVHQDTFLFHGTIEENIRMGNQNSDLKEIIEAAKKANIHEFVKTLPEGYKTFIGEKGIKLSGGQRQRVAIARAILKDSPILILDEALSAVDAENEYIIQKALDELMKKRTTIVLAHRLSSVIKCEKILVLENGKVIESGTHSKLWLKKGVYSQLMKKQVEEFETNIINNKDDEVNFNNNLYEDQFERNLKDMQTEGILKAEGLNWRQLVFELMKHIIPWKGRLTLSFCFGVLRVLSFIGVGFFSALIILSLKNNSDFYFYLYGLTIVASISGILHWLESWVAHDMAFRLLSVMRINVFKKLDQLAPAYLVRRRTGDLMGVATHDVELIEYFFAHTVAPVFVSILVPTSVIIILTNLNYWVALALLPFLLAVGFSPFLMRKKVDELGSKSREAAGELSAHAIDTIQGLAEIVAFQQENYRGKDFEELTNKHIALRLPFFNELTKQKTFLEVLTGWGGLAVVCTGAINSFNGTLDPGLIPLLTILSMAAFLPVSEIAQIGRQLADTLGATRRFYALENEPISIKDGTLNSTEKFSTGFKFNDVTFSYPSRSILALKKLNFEINIGQTLALVGPSGSGKTSLAQLLMRFWDPEKGSITLNGQDLKLFKLDDLRAKIALVSQDTYLFNNSLRENIMIAKPNASELDLSKAIQLSSLKEVVDRLPNGLDTLVGERGSSLSGGQRQRVSIARAFLKNAPILILDEATSHLDAISEYTVHKALNKLKKERTTLIIAHRLSTIKDADQIIVLKNGCLAETGSHEELIKKNGIYKQLVSKQLGITNKK